MTPEQRAAIEAALWPAHALPSASVWALLDCAREPAIYRLLVESRLEFRSLYNGTLARELEQVSPHLVELPPGHRLAARLLEAGWARSWGVFIHTDDAANLRHALRKLLKVQADDGRTLLFRFYDPRVLRAFLPTTDAVQRAAMFSAVTAWLAEDAGGGLLEFRLNAQAALLRRRVVQANTHSIA